MKEYGGDDSPYVSGFGLRQAGHPPDHATIHDVLCYRPLSSCFLGGPDFCEKGSQHTQPDHEKCEIGRCSCVLPEHLRAHVYLAFGVAFVFLGFLPRRKKDRLAVLANVCAMPCPLVVYEGPHRLKTMVADLRAVLGDREVTLCRELTKAHEEVKLTRLATLVQMYRDETPRGEFTLVIAGAEEMKKSLEAAGAKVELK